MAPKQQHQQLFVALLSCACLTCLAQAKLGTTLDEQVARIESELFANTLLPKGGSQESAEVAPLRVGPLTPEQTLARLRQLENLIGHQALTHQTMQLRSKVKKLIEASRIVDAKCSPAHIEQRLNLIAELNGNGTHNVNTVPYLKLQTRLQFAHCGFKVNQAAFSLGQNDRDELELLERHVDDAQKWFPVSSGDKQRSAAAAAAAKAGGLILPSELSVAAGTLAYMELQRDSARRERFEREFDQRIGGLCRRVCDALGPPSETFYAQLGSDLLALVEPAVLSWVKRARICSMASDSKELVFEIYVPPSYVAASAKQDPFEKEPDAMGKFMKRLFKNECDTDSLFKLRLALEYNRRNSIESDPEAKRKLGKLLDNCGHRVKDAAGRVDKQHRKQYLEPLMEHVRKAMKVEDKSYKNLANGVFYDLCIKEGVRSFEQQLLQKKLPNSSSNNNNNKGSSSGSGSFKDEFLAKQRDEMKNMCSQVVALMELPSKIYRDSISSDLLSMVDRKTLRLVEDYRVCERLSDLV